MSTVQDSISTPAAVDAEPKKTMTVGLGHDACRVRAAGHHAAVREELHHLPDDDGADLRHRHPGPQSVDRRQRTVLARSKRLLRGRRLYRRHSDGTSRRQLRADDSSRRHHLLHLRLPVRLSALRLSGVYLAPRDLRTGGRDAADPQAERVRALDRRRAGPRHHQAGRAVRPEDVSRTCGCTTSCCSSRR